MNYNTKDYTIGLGNKFICVIGLGYVGLPLAILFSKKYNVIGFDVSGKRIASLKQNIDYNGETTEEELKKSKIQFFTITEPQRLSEPDVFIVTVPTPVDSSKQPDLSPIRLATEAIVKYSDPKKKILVVYESTVYPGVTEDVCVPLLSQHHYVWKKDFHVGYSPERINPGDKIHTIGKTEKVVAGDTPEVSEFLKHLYGSVIDAKIHVAPNIKTAEASKVIENTQRDLNIALINELSLIFHRIGIDTRDVLAAAGTKWNFHKYEPGLVGGHCFYSGQLITFKRNDEIKTISIMNYVKDVKNNNFYKDEIFSFDLLSKRACFQSITKVSHHKNVKEMIYFDDDYGFALGVTIKHPIIIYENNEFLVKHAENIRVGDKIPRLIAFPNRMDFTSIKKISRHSHHSQNNSVYSVEVENTKTLITNNGIIVHNCIGVDPYYLTFKAESLGYHPDVILSGRRVNDNMGKFIAENTVKKLIETNKPIRGSSVLILGATFKENIKDIRNSKIFDIYHALREFQVNPCIYDPNVDRDSVYREYGVYLVKDKEYYGPHSAIILAVKHDIFKTEFAIDKIKEISTHPPILIDIKGMYDPQEVEKAGIIFWRL